MTSLLGRNQADVVLIYSHKKEIIIFGDETDVFHACIERIKLKRDKGAAEKTVQKFIAAFKITPVGTKAILEELRTISFKHPNSADE